MNIEKKGIMYGAIWGLISLISLICPIAYTFQPILAEYTIYLHYENNYYGYVSWILSFENGKEYANGTRREWR